MPLPPTFERSTKGAGEVTVIAEFMAREPSLKREQLTAAVLLCLFLAGTAVSVVSRKEYWPFCTYPMFRKLWTADVTVYYRVVGVTAGGERVLLDKVTDYGTILPSRIQRLLKRIALENDETKKAEGMAFVHKLGRAKDFPTLELYAFQWAMKPFEPDHPSRELLYTWTF